MVLENSEDFNMSVNEVWVMSYRILSDPIWNRDLVEILFIWIGFTLIKTLLYDLGCVRERERCI